MKRAAESLILALSLLMIAFSVPTLVSPKTSLLQQADGYNFLMGNCKWGTTITWKSVSLTSVDLADTRTAITFWNDAGANFFMDEITTGTANIEYYSVSRSDVTWYGLATSSTRLNGNFNGQATVQINDYKTGQTNHDLIQNVAGHETGHAIGLDHTQPLDSDGGRAIMWASVDSNNIAPTLDDIRGAKAKYGAKTSTSQCTEWDTNGDVVYTGTCSSSNPALPMREYIITAGTNSKAVATTTSSVTTLPSNGAFMITAKVKATTVNKFIMGAFTSTDVANTLNRVMAIEMSSDGFWLFRSSTSGYTRTPISTSTPTVGQEYFLQLIVRSGGLDSKAFVFKNDGGATDPPSWVGNIATATVQLPWTSSVYYATGDWTTSTTQPKPDYNISEYHNLLKSYT